EIGHGASPLSGKMKDEEPRIVIQPSTFPSHPEPSKHTNERIVELIADTLLQWDNGVVGNGDAFRADLVAAFRDVAQADTVGLLQLRQPIRSIERVHFERGDVDQETRADELAMHLVISQDVADVLAEEALDALAELLDAVHIGLAHAPGAIGSIGG